MKFEHLKHELSEVSDFLISLGDEKRQAKIVNYRSEGTRNFYYLEHDTSEIMKLQHFLDEVTRIMKGKQEK